MGSQTFWTTWSPSHKFNWTCWVRNLIDFDEHWHKSPSSYNIGRKVESWATHLSFATPKATITLKDVTVQLGLPIDGELVMGDSSGDLVCVCEELLKFVAAKTMVQGNTINISWLNSSFWDLAHDAIDVIITQHAWVHLLRLIGNVSMSDTSKSQVHLMYLLLLVDLNNVSNFSWGSTVLACLYRALDHNINYN